MLDHVILSLASFFLIVEPWAVFAASVVAGIFVVLALNFDFETIWAKIFYGAAGFSALWGPAAWGYINFILAPRYGIKGLPSWHILAWVGLLMLGVLSMLLFIRRATPAFERVMKKLTVRTSLERNKKIDVREIEKFLPNAGEAYDPKKYFKSGKYFLGLGEDGKPIYLETALPHVQVAGTTGSGKGVFLGMLEAQAVRNKAAVFRLDPKDDEWGAHVMYDAAQEAGVDYHYIDLRPAAGAQFNFFDGANAEEIEELFLAGFGLTERGSAEDFYRIADRKAASECAAIAGMGGYTAAQLYAETAAEIEKNAPYFAGLLREMGELKAVNARGGIDLAKIIGDGGAVYVVGSMRNAKVIRMQRMFLVRLIQLAEKRDRNSSQKPRPIIAVLDELKYHISRPALEALGAARDKGLHVLMAHQSLKDLMDCPADLNPDAVTGAVMENGRLKLVYRVEDPETCEWLARKSGKIQVDDETRQVTKNIALAERVEGARTIRQSERYYIDEDVIGLLPQGVGIVYGVGLAKYVRTSPLKVNKRSEALQTKVVAGDTVTAPAEAIAVEALPVVKNAVPGAAPQPVEPQDLI